MAPGRAALFVCGGGGAERRGHSFVPPSGAGQPPDAELGVGTGGGPCRETCLANRLSASGAWVAGPRRTEITLKLRRVGSAGGACAAPACLGRPRPSRSLLGAWVRAPQRAGSRLPGVTRMGRRAAAWSFRPGRLRSRSAATSEHGGSWAGRPRRRRAPAADLECGAVTADGRWARAASPRHGEGGNRK